MEPLFKHSATTETSKEAESVAIDETFATEETVLRKQKAEETVKAEPSIKSNQKVELSFLKQYNQDPSDCLSKLQTFDNQAAKSETISKKETVATETIVKIDESIKTTAAGLYDFGQ